MDIPTFFSARFAADLAGFQGFTVSGADATTFLQGQLTNDVVKLSVGRQQRTGYCTPKGRLLATFLQWRIDDQSVGHLMPAALMAQTVKRLRMYVLRSKVSFSDSDAPLQVMGLWGEWTAAGRDALGGHDRSGVIAQDGGVCLIAESPCPVLGPRAWLVGPREAIATCMATISGVDMLSESAWQFSEIQNAQPWVWSATVEAFVPQMINFEVVGGVSFTKGCYPGQEVVARSQYLGKLKRRTFRVDLPALPPDVATPYELIGRDIWSVAQTSEPCGVVVSAAPMFNAQGQAQSAIHLLIECSLSAWDAGALCLFSTQGPVLAKAVLPYEFPAE